MKPIALLVLLLIQLELKCSCSVAASSRRPSAIVYNVSITEDCQIILREGSDPCLHVASCAVRDGYSVSDEINITVLSLLQHKLLSSPSGLSKLVVTNNFFLGCFLPPNNKCVAPSYKNMIQFHREKFLENQLEALENPFLGQIEDILRTFRDTINGFKLTDDEPLYLYYRAYVLQHNNSFIITRFGQSLQQIDRYDLSVSLYEAGVRNGLWVHRMQRPEWMFVPNLTSQPWHSNSSFSFSGLLEKHYGIIKHELDLYLGNLSNTLGKEPNTNVFTGNWTRLVLKTSPGETYTPVASHFQETVRIIREAGEDFLEVKFSLLKPGTHILPHTGPSNNRLRVHLCIVHTGGAAIRVGDEWRTWNEGKVLVFDSSWEHEVIHSGKDIRIVLILDIWHPECPDNWKLIY